MNATSPAPRSRARCAAARWASESRAGGTWRYRATRQGVVVIFAFDTDDDGNLLVVVTTWRTG